MAMNSDGYVRIEDISQFVGVTVQRIHQLTQDGIIKSEKIPLQAGRMYHFLTTIRSLMHYYRDKANQKTERYAPNEALIEAKLQETDLRIRKLQVQTELAEKKVHTTDDVRRVWGDIVGTFRMQMFNLPQVAADKFVGLKDRETAHDVLAHEIKTLCSLLLEYDTDMFFEIAEREGYIDDDKAGEMTEYEGAAYATDT